MVIRSSDSVNPLKLFLAVGMMLNFLLRRVLGGWAVHAEYYVPELFNPQCFAWFLLFWL